jgi:ABC-type uncharacterized transport system substrate-binding protein
MIALICFLLAVLASPFKSTSRLEAENAVLRHQLIVLRRRVGGRAQPTNNDRWFLVQMYRWFPSILKVVTIVQPETPGLVASFNRPGGNFTGFTIWTNEMESKRLGLLRELLPAIPLLGVLANPKFAPTAQELEDLELASKEINQRLFVASANNDAELDAALISLTQQRVGAFLVTAAPFFDTRLDRIVRFAAENRLPAIYHFREYAIAGGLITYGPNFNESYHNAGVYAGRILKGAKPADLPVLQPTKFDFVINLKAANALGLTVPPTLVAQASEVIE